MRVQKSRYTHLFQQSWLLRPWLLIAVALTGMAGSQARAACTTSICVASPPSAPTCTIASGSYTINNGCVLNFPSDKEVIVARGATLMTASIGHSYTINAKALT